jgi:hypothetical protein
MSVERCILKYLLDALTLILSCLYGNPGAE